MSGLREKILDASVTLVEEQGVRAISFREVARRAGVSHQAPYHHFGNHHGILRAIAAEGFEQLAIAMQRGAADAGPGPLDALSAAGLAYVEFARSHAGHFRVMFQRTLVDIRDRDAPLEQAEGAHDTLVRLALAAHEAGYGKHLSVDGLTNLCWSTVHGIAVLLVEGVLTGTDVNEDELTHQVVLGLTALLRSDSEITE